MPSLTSIPRELRDQICEYVILAPARDPPALDQSFEQLTDGYVAYKRPRPENTFGVIYRPQPIASDASNLLLVNHQIHTETTENLKRIRDVSYDLDIIIADEVIPVATWTSVPFLTTNVKQLNATFRISGSYDATKQRPWKDQEDGTPAGAYARFSRYTGWVSGDGGPPPIHWQIYSLLTRFVQVGPLGERSREDENHHFTVKVLNINVETPGHIDPARFGRPALADGRRRGEDVSVLNPDYLVLFIEELVHKLMDHNLMDHNNLMDGWFHYGKVLFEHVDEVCVSKDGQERYRWRFDVAQRLKGYPELEKDVMAYKKEAWRLRKERGLKVLE